MGIRQKLNQAPKGAIVVIILLVLAVYGFIAWQLHRPRFGSAGSTRSFYTDDDGKTYFADDGTRMPPFDHDGQPAVRCYIYTCNGQPFVGYLEKYTDGLIGNLDTPFDPKHRELGHASFRDGTLCKRPGETKWVKEFSSAGREITQVRCPDGSNQTPAPAYP